MTSAAVLAATLARLRGEATPVELDWEELVAFASAQLVLPALHPMPGAPADAAAYLEGIQAANAGRNAQMRASLAAVGKALNGLGIEPVLLKGAALLATSNDGCSWRFLSDLDLLAPADRLEAAAAAARRLGFAARASDYNPARDAHYPALIAPCGRFALELHTRIFAGHLLPALETRLPARATGVIVDGAAFRLPALPDRIAHLIAHAQLHHGHYRNHRLLLRGFLELCVLTGGEITPEHWSEVLEVFATKGQKQAANAYLAAWKLLMRPRGDSLVPVSAPPLILSFSPRRLLQKPPDRAMEGSARLSPPPSPLRGEGRGGGGGESGRRSLLLSCKHPLHGLNPHQARRASLSPEGGGGAIQAGRQLRRGPPREKGRWKHRRLPLRPRSRGEWAGVRGGSDGGLSGSVATTWAARAVNSLGLPPRSRAIRAIAANLRAEILRALRDPAILARHLATLANPKSIAARIARHRQSLKQAFWA